MFLTALVLGLIGLVLVALGARATFRLLRLDPREALLWLGLAEMPAPRVARRERFGV